MIRNSFQPISQDAEKNEINIDYSKILVDTFNFVL